MTALRLSHRAAVPCARAHAQTDAHRGIRDRPVGWFPDLPVRQCRQVAIRLRHSAFTPSRLSVPAPTPARCREIDLAQCAIKHTQRSYLTVLKSLGKRSRGIPARDLKDGVSPKAERIQIEEIFVSKKAYALAVVALLGATPVALAAQPAHSTAGTQNQELIQPDRMRARKMIGSRVYDLHNRNIGRVRRVILGGDGKISLIVLHVGGFFNMGGKNVAVKPTEIKTDNSRLTLNVSKEQLSQIAKYKPRIRNIGTGSSASPVPSDKLGSGR